MACLIFTDHIHLMSSLRTALPQDRKRWCFVARPSEIGGPTCSNRLTNFTYLHLVCPQVFHHLTSTCPVLSKFRAIGPFPAWNPFPTCRTRTAQMMNPMLITTCRLHGMATWPACDEYVASWRLHEDLEGWKHLDWTSGDIWWYLGNWNALGIYSNANGWCLFFSTSLHFTNLEAYISAKYFGPTGPTGTTGTTLTKLLAGQRQMERLYRRMTRVIRPVSAEFQPSVSCHFHHSDIHRTRPMSRKHHFHHPQIFTASSAISAGSTGFWRFRFRVATDTRISEAPGWSLDTFQDHHEGRHLPVKIWRDLIRNQRNQIVMCRNVPECAQNTGDRWRVMTSHDAWGLSLSVGMLQFLPRSGRSALRLWWTLSPSCRRVVYTCEIAAATLSLRGKEIQTAIEVLLNHDPWYPLIILIILITHDVIKLQTLRSRALKALQLHLRHQYSSTMQSGT